MPPDSELGEVYRALGRIEGRLQAVEQRADRDSLALKEFMTSLSSKVETMSSSIEDLRMSREKQRGGVMMLACVAGGAASLGGLIASYLRMLFP